MTAPTAAERGAITRFLSAFARHDPRGLAMVLSLSTLRSATEAFAYLLLVPLLAHAGLQAAAVPALPRAIAAPLGWIGAAPSIPVLLAAFLLAAFLRAALGYATAITTARHLGSFCEMTRQRLHAALMRAGWQHLAEARQSRGLQALSMQVESIHTVAQGFLTLASTLFAVAAGLLAAVLVSPRLTLAGLLVGLPVATLLALHQRRAYRLGQRALEAAHRLFDTLASHFAALKVAKAFAIEAKLEREFAARSDDYLASKIGIQRNAARAALLQELAIAGLLAAAIYASTRIFAGTSAELAVMIVIFARLLPLLFGVQAGLRAIAETLPEHDALREIERRAVEAGEPLPSTARRLTLRQAMTLEAVTFAHAGTPNAPTLRGVTLEIAAGTATGIVGPSGAGKSTLLDVMAGLVRPTGGRIAIDGRPLDETTRPEWRAGVTYLPQDAPLLHDTLRANLLIGAPEGTDDDAIWAALESIGAAALVRSLPSGLDTVAGDRGVRLSGGERQRIRLASALLRQPAVLLLDEATSALSPSDEFTIIEALRKIRGRTTIVAVAHRPGTVAWMDGLVELRDGAVVEAGPAAEVLARMEAADHAGNPKPRTLHDTNPETEH